MATLTTTTLSWSASWFQTPSMADREAHAANGQSTLHHGSAVVSTTDNNSSQYDDADGDTVALSDEAQTYISNTTTQFKDSTGTVQKIYDTLASIISSSNTSDAQKWAAYVTSDEMRFESQAHAGSGADGLVTAFDQKTENTAFMKTINAALADIKTRNLQYDDQQPVSIPIERALLYLQQREQRAAEEEVWGSSSLSIHIQASTLQTGAGTETSFTLSSNFSGQEFLGLGNAYQSPLAVDSSSSGPYNFSPSGNTTSIQASFGSLGTKNAEREQDMIDELFASPSQSPSSSGAESDQKKMRDINHDEENSAS